MSSRLPLSRKSIRVLCKGQQITEKGIKAEKLADGAEGDVRYTTAVMVDGKREHRVIGKASMASSLRKPKRR